MVRFTNINTIAISTWLFQVLKRFYLGDLAECSKVSFFLTKLLSVPEFIEFLRLNKVMVGIAELCNAFSCRNKLLDQRFHRYRIYMEEARRISEAFEINDIRFVVIKTISTFPKDVADIDILVDSKNRKLAEETLSKIGYRKRKIGLEQNLWSIIRDDVVDVELHTSVAASGFKYYPSEMLFENAIELNGVRIPSRLDSVVLTAAHSVIKDLYITLADLLDFYLALVKNKITAERVIEYAKTLGLATPVQLYLFVIERIYEGKSTLALQQNPLLIIDQNTVPARPGITAIVYSYSELLVHKLKLQGAHATLTELTTLFQSKGLDALIHYLARSKPPIKQFWE